MNRNLKLFFAAILLIFPSVVFAQQTKGEVVTMGGMPIHTVGMMPKVGDTAPEATLCDTELKDVTAADFKGKKIILNVFPSVDTRTCSASVRAFNQKAADIKDAVVLCVSKDLPFAMKRFCGAEGIKNVHTLSDFRSDFGTRYGLLIADGPLKGLLARAVIVIDTDGKVLYTELVKEISKEPNYDAALKVLK